jgi:hypothetical protein
MNLIRSGLHTSIHVLNNTSLNGSSTFDLLQNWRCHHTFASSVWSLVTFDSWFREIWHPTLNMLCASIAKNKMPDSAGQNIHKVKWSLPDNHKMPPILWSDQVSECTFDITSTDTFTSSLKSRWNSSCTENTSFLNVGPIAVTRHLGKRKTIPQILENAILRDNKTKYLALQ